MNLINFVDPRGKEVVRAELGKYDVFTTQRIKTGKWWLDLTIVGAFNELRNAAALTTNMGANLLGISSEMHDLVVESADKLGVRIGISNSGNIQDFVQFSEIYFMVNASQWSSAVSQLKGYLVPAMENAGVGALNAYRNSPLASESGHIGEVDDIWLVDRHGNMPRPRPSGTESHHGVNSVWAEANIPGYEAVDAPAILMKQDPHHNATRGIFNRIRMEIASRQGVSPRNIDWTKVQSGTAWRIAEEQFDIAKIPVGIRKKYWKLFNEYLLKLQK